MSGSAPSPEQFEEQVERLAVRLNEEINPGMAWQDLIDEGNSCIDAIRARARSYLAAAYGAPRPTPEQFEELKSVLPKPHADLHE